jgi:hypothetical protein
MPPDEDGKGRFIPSLKEARQQLPIGQPRTVPDEDAPAKLL